MHGISIEVAILNVSALLIPHILDSSLSNDLGANKGIGVDLAESDSSTHNSVDPPDLPSGERLDPELNQPEHHLLDEPGEGQQEND